MIEKSIYDEINQLLKEYKEKREQIAKAIIDMLKEKCVTYQELEAKIEELRRDYLWSNPKSGISEILSDIKDDIEKEKSSLKIIDRF